ncbi:hypothetical protein K5A21_002863 [Listeria innocua]|uniref:hypothetical protein n=1 Tax=Listeria TaxID=1637 RepID=UPI000F1682CC|nr:MULTISPECIES: hypothetical protein [Listeria]EAC7992074.1 hypothetical protein [Listeria monocytogenes]EAC8007146.1 hypothetical protein [Listeria monocytogenes]EAD6723867.1 hypothetical protein [Listeria monocytogenes]EAE0719586.1 hypothetical protein [Listeria monocytogenes]EAE3417563.1 hypothetical protein [Listeria monocytogenes]
MENKNFETFPEAYERMEEEANLPEYTPILDPLTANTEIGSVILETKYQQVLNKQGKIEYIKAGEKVLDYFDDLTSSIDKLTNLATPVENDGQSYSPFDMEQTFKRTQTQFSKTDVAVQVPELISHHGTTKIVTSAIPVSKSFVQASIKRMEMESGLQDTPILTVEEREKQAQTDLIKSVVNTQVANLNNPTHQDNHIVTALRNGYFTESELAEVVPNYQELLG